MGAVYTIDLRRLEDGPVEVRGEIAADDPVWRGSGLKLTGPVTCAATAEGARTRGVRVRGRLSGRVDRACRRCLKPVELTIAEEFDLLFDPKTSRIEEDLKVYALDASAEELDLKPALRERFMLAAPAYAVCRQDCRGLCARCGTDLNEGACDCGSIDTDPRWGPLAALLKET